MSQQLIYVQKTEQGLKQLMQQLVLKMQMFPQNTNPDPNLESQRQSQLLQLKQEISITQGKLQELQHVKHQLQQQSSMPMGMNKGNFHGNNNLNLMHQNSNNSQGSNHGYQNNNRGGYNGYNNYQNGMGMGGGQNNN